MRIVTIGGGNGASTVISSLVMAKYSNLIAISATMDSGGRSGMVRTDERDRVVSIGDLFQCFLAMIDPVDAQKESINSFIELASFTDGRNRNLGYTLFYGLLEKYEGDFLRVQEHLQRLLGVTLRGRALPISQSVSHISFKTISGQRYVGEHLLDYYQMSQDEVTDICLEPIIEANKEALQAISDAEILIYCPGSLYGSLLANFLPMGVKEALRASRARKILLTNLVSDRNQTHGITPDRYLEILKQYTGLERPVDELIIPKLSRRSFEEKYPQVAERYALEHSHFLGWDKNAVQVSGLENIAVKQEDVFTVTSTLGRIRHDPEKLAQLWKRIL